MEMKQAEVEALPRAKIVGMGLGWEVGSADCVWRRVGTKSEVAVVIRGKGWWCWGAKSQSFVSWRCRKEGGVRATQPLWKPCLYHRRVKLKQGLEEISSAAATVMIPSWAGTTSAPPGLPLAKPFSPGICFTTQWLSTEQLQL